MIQIEVSSSEDERNSQNEEESAEEGSSSEEDPSVGDPEDYIDDEDLLGDLLKQRPKETINFNSTVVVDGLPTENLDCLARYKSGITKIFGTFGPIASEFYPVNEKGNPKGYMFLEFTTPLHARRAVGRIKQCKTRKFEAYLFTNFAKSRAISKAQERPVIVTGQASQNTDKQPTKAAAKRQPSQVTINSDAEDTNTNTDTDTATYEEGGPSKRARISAAIRRKKEMTTPTNNTTLSEDKALEVVPEDDKNDITLQETKRALSPSFEMSKSHLKVAIIDINHPLGKLGTVQAQSIMSHIRKELQSTISAALAKNAPAPIFDDVQHSGEILRISCGDQASRDWLSETTERLPQLWAGVKLAVTPLDLLPRLTKAVVWIPGQLEEVGLVLGCLKTQNRWVDVAKWPVFQNAVRTDPLGRLMVFGVPDADKKVIKEKGGKLYYVLGSLPVTFQKDSFNGIESMERKTL